MGQTTTKPNNQQPAIRAAFHDYELKPQPTGKIEVGGIEYDACISCGAIIGQGGKPRTCDRCGTQPPAPAGTPLKSKTLKWVEAEIKRLAGTEDKYCQGKAQGLKSIERMLRLELEDNEAKRTTNQQRIAELERWKLEATLLLERYDSIAESAGNLELGELKPESLARFVEGAKRRIAELEAALAELFEQCAMIHKHWGDNSNQREADAAIANARVVLNRKDGE